MTTRKGVFAGLALMALACFAPFVAAEYPERQIQVVVPYPPGGSVDVLMRLVGPKLTAVWGQPILIENRAGAGGSVGAAYVAKARPDGYTLLVATNSPFTTNPVFVPNIGYDPVRDFEPVIVVGESSLFLLVNPKLPVKSVAQLIALAKQKPKNLNAGTSGNGTTAHLSLAQFNKMTGVDIVPVPYKGGAPSLIAAVTGEVQMSFIDVVPAMQFIRDGRLRVLASTGLRRTRLLPDVPTLAESGLPGFNVGVWNGMVAPKGTPKDIVQKLNSEIAKIFRDPGFRKQLTDMGIDPLSNTPEEFADLLSKEIPRWRDIVTQAGLKIE